MRSTELPGATPFPENLAYVIFTSGSTGRPKGVAVTHHNLRRLFRRTEAGFGPGPDDVWTLFHSFAFDFSVWEIWGALLYGGRLVVVPSATARDPERFQALLRREGVTVLNQTPAALRQLIAVEADPSVPLADSLRLVILGGEALDYRSLAPWLARRDGQAPRVVNMYGITETTVHVTWRPVAATEVRLERSPIGRPIDDLAAWVLDPELRPLPLGAAGELYVGGGGVARGYLGAPALTAGRFLPDPFSEVPGGRLFRTGDLARRLAGELEFVGRGDDQIKLRGHRIEPGEIETCLLADPGVADAAVLLQRRSPGGADEDRLIAFVVPAPGQTPTPDGLRSRLRLSLPPVMVPERFVLLDALPLTPHGKVDRRTLLAGDVAERSIDDEAAAPQTATEMGVAAVWEEVLGRRGIGLRDSFFELGGHSLLALQVVARLRDRLGVKLPVQQLFEAPDLQQLSRRIDELRAEDAPALPPLRRAPRGGPFPLSFAQQRLWILDQLDGPGALYNVPGALDLDGALDTAALERAWNGVVRRHEILRTSFADRDGSPEQAVEPWRPMPLPVIDLSALPAVARDDEEQRWREEAARRPFDLRRAPLVRALLLRRAAGEHALLVTLHHIVCDEGSLGVLLGELGALYRGAPLPELPFQYADYALWQREALQGERRRRLVEFWTRALAGAPARLDLAPDRRAPPAAAAHAGRRHPLRIDLPTAVRLRETARRGNGTLFMAVLAGFAVTLRFQTGAWDLVAGTPAAQREIPELERLIGLFTNTLALRLDLSGDPSLETVLERARRATLDALAHQDLPFEQLVEELHPERDPEHSPLFQVFLSFERALAAPPALPGLAMRSRKLDNGAAKFALSLHAEEDGEHLRLTLDARRHLFTAADLAGLGAHLQAVIEVLAREPERRLSEVPWWSPAERHQLLCAWNDTRQDGAPATLHGLFGEQARRTPRRVAVEGAGERLSYAGLDRRAERLARVLRARGVGPETRVAVCLPRSPGMIAGLLAVLKAGGTFVPLDPEAPPERLRFLLEDSQARLVLCGPRQARMLKLAPGRWLDPGAARPAGTAAEPLGDADPGAAAYLIYTSGSTGRPKGVVVSHEAACNHMLWLQRAFPLGPADRVLQKTPVSFDAALWEIFGPLLAGARLVLARPDAHRDVAELAAELAESRITVLMLVPTLLAALLGEPGFAAAGRLRLVLSAGEELHPALRDRFLARSPARLVNLYGPTEAAIDVTAEECRRGEDNAGPVSIGRPVDNTVLHVLGRDLELLPAGAPGELWIGGVQLARGYAGRPDLTAERFLPDPFGRGGRLYRSGDLARRRTDGRIDLLGRTDHQIKLGGIRVEPGEIEAALLRIPGIRQAAVVARENGGRGRRSLLAFLVAQEGAEPPAPAALRAQLRAWLPDALVPAVFAFVAELPLTSSGKLDRTALRALPAPGGEQSPAPAGARERRLAALWRDLLGLAEVGTDQSFFALGGDSILGLQLVARARQQGLELTLRQIFEHQTLAELAQVAVERGATEERPAPPAGPVQLLPSQLWFLEQPRAEPGLFNQAALFDLSPGTRPAWLYTALAELLRHHEGLRLRCRRDPETSAWQALAEIITPGDEAPPFTWVDLRGLPEEPGRRAAAVVCAAAHRGLDLGRGPLFRAVFLQGAPEALDRLLLTFHHLVIDGVSWRILLEDLGTAVRQLAGGAPISLPPRTTSPFDQAVYLERRAADLAGEAAWWTAAGAPGEPLPCDFPERPERPGAHAAGAAETCTVELDAVATRELLRAPHPPLALLLTALVRALQRWTGGDLWQIELEGHGREDFGDPEIDLTRTVGWLSVSFPALFDLRGAPAAEPALGRVQETLRRIPHGGLGFSLLRRQLTEQPAPQILFNYLGHWTRDLLQPPLAGAEILGTLQGERDPRAALLEVNAAILDERLRVDWIFSRHLHRRATIEALAASFLELLAELAALPPSEVEAVHRLTPAEEGMFFESFAAGRHVEQAAWTLRGPVDPASWRRALHALTERHPALRSVFLWPEGDAAPHRAVLRAVPTPFAHHDLSALDPAGQRRALARQRRRARQSLRPGEAPLLRLELLDLGGSLHELVITHHHLILDGWSFFLLLDELCAELRGERAPAPPAAHAERRGPPEAELEKYWRLRLAGFRQPTPLGRPASARTGTADGPALGRLRGALPETLSARLAAALRRAGQTLGGALEALWALLLSRYSGERDVLFGVTVSGRQAAVPGIDRAVGLFIHTLPVRMKIPSRKGWWDWLAALQRQRLDDHEHGPCAAGQLQTWSEISEGLPLYESLLVVENYPLDRSRLAVPGVEIGPPRFWGAQTRHPLVLLAVPGRRLSLEVIYDRRRFSPEAAERILDHLRRLIAALLADPNPIPAALLAAIPKEERPAFFAPPPAAASAPPVRASPLEERLLGLWREILGRADLGLHDQFFDLGGHSLQALQLVSRLSRELGREVPVRTLLLHPTVADLATALGEEPGTQEQRRASRRKTPAPGEDGGPQIVRQAPLTLHALGRLAPLDAVALGCLPPALLGLGMDRNRVIRDWCQGLPVLIGERASGWGRIGVILLPRFIDDLYRDPAGLLSEITDALALARHLGARVVSLTGLIPSATGYGRDIQRALAGRNGLPAITTGHATTCAAVVLSIERIVAEAGREIGHEQAAFVGLGSIGSTTLRTLLARGAHPAEILLCDVYRKLPDLEALAAEIRRDAGFSGRLRIAPAGPELPPEVYEASLLIGATNVADILDVERLRPGALLVDDSAPHCFDPAAALRRVREREDLLIGEGGFLQSPQEIRDTFFLPPHVEAQVGLDRLRPLLDQSAHEITGCVFSSLLSQRFPDLPPTLGEVDPATCRAHLAALDRLGLTAPAPRCEGHPPWPQDFLRRFRERFGGPAGRDPRD